MVKHIVMWKLKDFPEEEKHQAAEELKSRLLSLKDSISVIRKMEVGINSPEAAQTNYEVVLIAEFNSFEDLKTYQLHPDHLRLKDYLETIRDYKVATDFEY
ncbi:MAG TPA: Dabb family protein [Bacteroidales bacterium]|nr:Dabb family protein [Bacteroidales bacterium]